MKALVVRGHISVSNYFVLYYFIGAGNGIRTRDLQLGKLTLYH